MPRPSASLKDAALSSLPLSQSDTGDTGHEPVAFGSARWDQTEMCLWRFTFLAICSRDSLVKMYGNPRSADTFHMLLVSTSFKDSRYVVPSQAVTAAEIRTQGRSLTLAATREPARQEEGSCAGPGKGLWPQEFVPSSFPPFLPAYSSTEAQS